jgi:ketosteroid isomerase-like protein
MLRSFHPEVCPTFVKTRIQTFLFVPLLLVSAACQTQPAAPDTRATDESALKMLDSYWSQAAATKDVDKTVSYYSDDAIVMPPNSPTTTGKEPIHALWKGILGAPGFVGGWKPLKVEVARSSDLGYVSGSYEFTENDASGKPITDKGKYVEVWKKQTDSGWKCVVNIFNSDLPSPAFGENKKAAEKSK